MDLQILNYVSRYENWDEEYAKNHPIDSYEALAEIANKSHNVIYLSRYQMMQFHKLVLGANSYFHVAIHHSPDSDRREYYYEGMPVRRRP
jgi:hypothetical protein